MKIKREWILDLLSLIGGWALLLIAAAVIADYLSPNSWDDWLDRLAIPLLAAAALFVVWRSTAMELKIEKAIARSTCLRKPLSNDELGTIAAQERVGRPPGFNGIGGEE